MKNIRIISVSIALVLLSACANNTYYQNGNYQETYEQERRQRAAFGHATMVFFNQMSRSVNPSTLGAINEAFLPASNAYRDNL